MFSKKAFWRGSTAIVLLPLLLGSCGKWGDSSTLPPSLKSTPVDSESTPSNAEVYLGDPQEVTVVAKCQESPQSSNEFISVSVRWMIDPDPTKNKLVASLGYFSRNESQSPVLKKEVQAFEVSLESENPLRRYSAEAFKLEINMSQKTGTQYVATLSATVDDQAISPNLACTVKE